MTQTPAAAREREADALHRLPETLEQFEATFAELRELIAQLALEFKYLDARLRLVEVRQRLPATVTSFPVLSEAELDELEPDDLIATVMREACSKCDLGTVSQNDVGELECDRCHYMP